MEKVDISLQYTYVDWKNAGKRFNTDSSELIVEDGANLIKHSIGFGFRYSY